jgi:hypothetical protein
MPEIKVSASVSLQPQTTASKKHPFPGVERFVFDTPLYETIGVRERDGSAVLTRSNIKIEGFCRDCKTHRVFRRSEGTTYDSNPIGHIGQMEDGFHVFEFECTKSERHKITVWIRISGDTVEKVGQFPSLADTANDAAKLYSKVLDPEDRKELSRAVGLAAHGVGIGSFVYMRRVFERLIDRRHTESGLTIDDFSRKRMNEKIEHLRDQLPAFLVENKAIYGVLSLGIHELTEDQCLAFYQILHESIVTILEDDRRKKDDDVRRKTLSDSIQKIQTLAAESKESG